MKGRLYTMGVTLLVCGGLSSCVLDTDPVPEMPYRPRPVAPAETPQEEPVQTTSWENAPTPSSFISAPATAPTKPLTPAAPAPAPAPQLKTQPTEKPAPVITPAPAPTPAPSPEPAPAPEPTAPTIIPPVVSLSTPTQAQTPEPAANTPAPVAMDPKLITNTGPIPTAVQVEGDPTRVWNPLDPSKKIRIINPKTNQPYPSGKKLKVRGTNFQFYVP